MQTKQLAVALALLGQLSANPVQSGSIVSSDGSFSQNVAGFGSQAAIDGQTALVACRAGQVISGTSTVYFYDRTPSGWTFAQQFSGVSYYSAGIDISGDHAVVGAPYINGEKLYIYERTGGVWAQKQIIDGYIDGHDWFGQAVAVDGDWAAVTAPESLHINGPIYVYQRFAGVWTPSTVLSDDDGWGAGESLDMSLPRIIAGDPEWSNKGAAEVFVIPALGGNGLVEAELFAPDATLNDDFGTSVAIQGDRAVIGAPFHHHGGVSSSGAAYVFERSGAGWSFTAELRATSQVAGEIVGTSVALDGDRVLAGGKNVAYLFERIGGTWTQTERLTPSTGTTSYGVAIDGTHALLGVRDARTVFAYTLTPEPVTYCTAKINSQGCTPAIGFSGDPSASLAQPFQITATDVINNKFGTLYYGVSGRLAAPFQGGYQCVAPPGRRTGLQMSAGNPPPDDCSGSYAFDFNARIQSGGDPALAAGVTVDAQFWSRDGQASFQTGLTDALELTIAP